MVLVIHSLVYTTYSWHTFQHTLAMHFNILLPCISDNFALTSASSLLLLQLSEQATKRLLLPLIGSSMTFAGTLCYTQSIQYYTTVICYCVFRFEYCVLYVKNYDVLSLFILNWCTGSFLNRNKKCLKLCQEEVDRIFDTKLSSSAATAAIATTTTTTANLLKSIEDSSELSVTYEDISSFTYLLQVSYQIYSHWIYINYSVIYHAAMMMTMISMHIFIHIFLDFFQIYVLSSWFEHYYLQSILLSNHISFHLSIYLSI